MGYPIFFGNYILLLTFEVLVGCSWIRPNFKPIKTGKGFDVVRYAMAVSNELLWALEGLVEKSE